MSKTESFIKQAPCPLILARGVTTQVALLRGRR